MAHLKLVNFNRNQPPISISVEKQVFLILPVQLTLIEFNLALCKY